MNTELQFFLYDAPDTNTSIQVYVKDETLYATQKAIADLFDVGIPAVSKHLKNIFVEGEPRRKWLFPKWK